MKHKLKYLIPFIPIIGIIVVLTGKTNSWFNKNRHGKFESILNDPYVFFFSVMCQGVSLALILISYLELC